MLDELMALRISHSYVQTVANMIRDKSSEALAHFGINPNTELRNIAAEFGISLGSVYKTS